jgi:hypothetical protein
MMQSHRRAQRCQPKQDKMLKDAILLVRSAVVAMIKVINPIKQVKKYFIHIPV